KENAGKNIFFSPYSIATALGMLADSGSTSANTVAALLYQAAPDLASSFTSLLHRWQANPNAIYDLKLANAGWFSDSLEFPQEYSERLQADFDAYIQRLTFAKNVEAATTINAWISQQTHGRIPQLIDAKLLSKETSFVLTNAIYFKGRWENGFDK